MIKPSREEEALGKKSAKPPKPPLERLPDWHEGILDTYFKGLPALYVRGLLDKAAAAERSEHATDSARRKHAEGNALKEKARKHYLANKMIYRSKKDAAWDLYTEFGELKLGTYRNWITDWSKY
jgi:hypothetical protein